MATDSLKMLSLIVHFYSIRKLKKKPEDLNENALVLHSKTYEIKVNKFHKEKIW